MSIDMIKHLNREPQIYKNIELYPLLLSDIHMYDLFSEIMCIPKEYIGSPEVSRMSYVRYLLFFIQGYSNFTSNNASNKQLLKEKFETITSHITKQKVSTIQVVDGVRPDDIRFHYDIYIGENKFTEYDFDKMREIILEQNGRSLSYIESFDPDLEKSLEIFSKSNKNQTLIDRIMVHSAISNIDITEMMNWTITEFEKKEEILNIYESWKMYKPLETSGQITIKSKDGIRSPFEYVEKSENRYASILIDSEDLMKDINQFAK